MTNRDKKLLMFLIVFIVLVGFVALILLPRVERLNEVNTRYDEAVQQKEEILLKVASYSQVEQTLQQKQVEFQELTEDFYPLMQAQEIDDLLTGMAIGHGLSMHQLNIGLVQAEVPLAAYMAEQESVNPDADSEDEEATISFIHQSQVSLVVSGSPDAMQRLVDELFDIPAMLVTGWQRASQGNGIEQQEVLQVSVTVFMCSK